MATRLPFSISEEGNKTMVAIFVLLTFLVLMTIDYILNRDKYHMQLAGADSTPSTAAGVTLPPTLAYHPGHTWALDEGNGHVRVGLDEFAASLLGHITHIELPKRGRWIQQGDRGFTVFTDNGPVSMPVPAEGEIIAINEKLINDPTLVSQDPYGKGWMIKIKADKGASLDHLLTLAQYEKQIASEEH